MGQGSAPSHQAVTNGGTAPSLVPPYGVKPGWLVKRRVASAAVLGLLILGVGALDRATEPVDKGFVGRFVELRPGMTPSEVDAVLGPAGDFRRYKQLGFAHFSTGLQPVGRRVHRTDDYSQVEAIFFGDANPTLFKASLAATPFESRWDRLYYAYFH